MKRLIFLTCMLLSLLGAYPALACEDSERPLRRQKDQGIRSEQPGPNLDGVVEVSFKIDNLGKVQILNINSTSPQLADYVIKKLGKIQLEQGDSQIGKVIRYRFVFKKQA